MKPVGARSVAITAKNGDADANKLTAEFFGTFWLVFGGCGSAVLAATFPGVGIGHLGVSLAFGLTVLTMACAGGHVPGGHFNPAVTLGLVSAGRFKPIDAVGYILVQVAGAIDVAFVLKCVAEGKPGFDLVTSGFAANGVGEHSPGGYAMGAALICEFVMTFFFLLVILGATGKRAPAAGRSLSCGSSGPRRSRAPSSPASSTGSRSKRTERL